MSTFLLIAGFVTGWLLCGILMKWDAKKIQKTSKK
jgi:uncharacterized membrane protein YciS (DUF1049 family)